MAEHPKFCGNCGASLVAGAPFCGECGQRVEAIAEAMQPESKPSARAARTVRAGAAPPPLSEEKPSSTAPENETAESSLAAAGTRFSPGSHRPALRVGVAWGAGWAMVSLLTLLALAAGGRQVLPALDITLKTLKWLIVGLAGGFLAEQFVIWRSRISVDRGIGSLVLISVAWLLVPGLLLVLSGAMPLALLASGPLLGLLFSWRQETDGKRVPRRYVLWAMAGWTIGGLVAALAGLVFDF